MIEDNQGDIRLIKEMLREQTFDSTLETCERLQTCVALLSSGNNYDVILLDLGLPDSQGIQTFKDVYTIAMQVPIIILTGFEDDTLASEAVRKGAQDYLVKGQFNGELLCRSITYAKERKRIETELKKYREHLEELVKERTKQLIQNQEALKYNNRKLLLLTSVTSELLSSANPPKLVQKLCEETVNFLDCDVFFNFLVDEEKGMLHLNAYTGVPAETANTIEWLSFGEAVCGCAAQKGERIVCEDIPNVEDERTALVRSFGVKAYAANPIVANGKVIGTLSFGTKKKPTFTEDELSLMTTLTAQVSVAMQRMMSREQLVRAEEQSRQQAEELKLQTKQLEQIKTKLEEKACEVEEYANQMEELAQDRLKKLKDAERLAAIGATAGMVAHDIRNPLQAVVLDLYFAKNDLTKLPYSPLVNSVHESLAAIESSVKYINKIVTDLQDYAKPVKVTKLEANLPTLWKEVVASINPPSNIIVFSKIDEDTEKIRTDPLLLKRILTNLATNAVQAMPKGGELRVEVCRNNFDVVIAVVDNGEGIPEDIKPKLFTPLVTSKPKGQGFGLPVVKRMTEALGGSVIFESERGKGTRFIINLPQASF